MEKIIIQSEDSQEEYIKVSELIQLLNNFCNNYINAGYTMIQLEQVSMLFQTLLTQLDSSLSWVEMKEEIILN